MTDFANRLQGESGRLAKCGDKCIDGAVHGILK